MEEVRKELQKTKDEVKQETAWVEQDSQARVQDSEAVESLKQRVNLFQPHGYLRTRGARRVGLVDDHDLRASLHRVEDRLLVQRDQ